LFVIGQDPSGCRLDQPKEDLALKVMIVYGTRPEAIKLAPLIAALDRDERTEPVVVVTGQHPDMVAQVNADFGIVPAYDLAMFQPGQSLDQIISRVLLGLEPVLSDEAPDAVVVQGDTASCFAGALVAFHAGIQVVHLEAGMRSGDLTAPYPEEMYRRLVGQIAALHLAASEDCKRHLLGEGVDGDSIALVGSTAIDSLFQILQDAANRPTGLEARLSHDRLVVVVTCHRRESWGQPLINVAEAVAALAKSYPDVVFLLTAHPNPLVRECLLPPLQGLDNVVVTEPLGYREFAAIMRRAYLLLTDSGGVQAEAPTVETPVLVLRDTTEYRETLCAGSARLVGTDGDVIIKEVSRLLDDKSAHDAMRIGYSPYGDGRAAERSVEAIVGFMRSGKHGVEDFVAAPGLGILSN
jgi:UDP-N-acetylglucosamine 2-epimerase (non-hydrolysing)